MINSKVNEKNERQPLPPNEPEQNEMVKFVIPILFKLELPVYGNKEDNLVNLKLPSYEFALQSMIAAVFEIISKYPSISASYSPYVGLVPEQKLNG